MKWCVIVAAFALSACSPFPKPEPQRQISLYMLDETGKIPRAAHATCGGIVVESVRAAPGYGTARMVFSRNPHQLEFFAYSAWADSPARMLQTLMVDALEKSGRFSTVLNQSADQAKLQLDAELVTLRQQFASNDSHLLLQMRIHLFNSGQVIATKLFQADEEAGNAPESGVAAANRATAKLSSELIAWLDEMITKGNMCRAQ